MWPVATKNTRGTARRRHAELAQDRKGEPEVVVVAVVEGQQHGVARQGATAGERLGKVGAT